MAYNIKRILKRETPDGWRVTGSGDGPYAAESRMNQRSVVVRQDGYGGWEVEPRKEGLVYRTYHADTPGGLADTVSRALGVLADGPGRSRQPEQDAGIFDGLF